VLNAREGHVLMEAGAAQRGHCRALRGKRRECGWRWVSRDGREEVGGAVDWDGVPAAGRARDLDDDDDDLSEVASRRCLSSAATRPDRAPAVARAATPRTFRTGCLRRTWLAVPACRERESRTAQQAAVPESRRQRANLGGMGIFVPPGGGETARGSPLERALKPRGTCSSVWTGPQFLA
jgi:hypothetical protein